MAAARHCGRKVMRGPRYDYCPVCGATRKHNGDVYWKWPEPWHSCDLCRINTNQNKEVRHGQVRYG